MEWCNSEGAAPAQPGLKVRLPQFSVVAMGGLVCVLSKGGLEVGGGSQVLELPKVRESHGEPYWQGPVVSRYWSFIGHSGSAIPEIKGGQGLNCSGIKLASASLSIARCRFRTSDILHVMRICAA